MISPEYYNQNNQVKVFFGGKVKHFLRKPRTVVADSFEMALEYRDNMYSLASDLFGADMQRLWPIIADINPNRLPDEWGTGEIVRLPKVIVTDVIDNNQLISYKDAESSTTLIQP